MLRIKEAIAFFNREHKPGKKMTQESLGLVVFAETPKSAGYYMSRWSNGLSYGKMRPEHVERICQECRVDANFLFGITPMK
jgi:hypothetical protein